MIIKKNRKNMKKEILDNKLKDASYTAFSEANRWRAVASKINDENGLFREKIVILAYASELYFKSILMYNEINITTIDKKEIGNGHSLYKLYKLCPEKIKSDILKNLKFEPVIVKDFYSGEVKKIYYSFEEILELVSNNFLDLRYIYEKYANNEPVLVVENIIEELSEYLHDIIIKQEYK